MGSGRIWTRGEILAAFVLYMHMPSSRLSYEEDEDIIALAEALGRTPGAVAIMLQNILAYDPNATRKGFRNASERVKRIWPEYAKRGDDLLVEAMGEYERITGRPYDVEFEKVAAGADATLDSEVGIGSADRLRQSHFRNALMDLYDATCCITGFGFGSLLVATHIKPTRECVSADEGYSVENGLLLNPLHSQAFCKGYISLDDDFKVLFSQEFEETCRKALETTDGSGIYGWLWETRTNRLRLPERHRPRLEFVEYHRRCVFLDQSA